MRIRETAVADAEAVAAVRVAGWRHAYGGLMPRDYLDALSVTEYAARHRERLAAARPGTDDLVATDDHGEVIGWASSGPYRSDSGQHAEDGELYTLYVQPEWIGTGVGWTLMSAVLDRAAKHGYPRLRLWVLTENLRARRFYERVGFAADGAENVFEVGGAPVAEVRYVMAMPEAPPRR